MRRTTQNRLLRDKGEFTKFQILLEVMNNQPHVKQKDVSDALGITVQAISKYFKKLAREGLLEAGSEKANYRLTAKALEKLREDVKNLNRYVTRIKNEMKVENLTPAIATKQVRKGEEVGLMMKEGILYAVPANQQGVEAFGVVVNDAVPGEDVGLSGLRGKVKTGKGKILIVKLPSIREGGSRNVDLAKVKMAYEEFKPDRVGVMGAVGRAVLNKLKLKADLEFGISRAVALAASRGLDVFVLVVGRMVNRMIDEIDSANLKNASDVVYEVVDGRRN